MPGSEPTYKRGPHWNVLGVTLSGKTTFLSALSKGIIGKGRKVAVLDPAIDSRWGADFITDDKEQFWTYIRRVRSHTLIIDEGGSELDRTDKRWDWLTTTGRHLGHNVMVISHRRKQLSPTLRMNLTNAAVFSCDPDDSPDLASHYSEPALATAHNLRPGEFYIVSRFSDTLFKRIDFKSGKVETLKIIPRRYAA